MNNNINIAGLDVHKETIVTGFLPSGMPRVTETIRIENNPKAIETMVKKIAVRGEVEFVYEAGPCGYEVHRQITKMGYRCVVIAPGLIPVRPGDRVKTDRRDAEKLARLYRAGELTEIRVPTREEESARDLVRVREDALQDQTRVRHRLTKFLLRQGRVFRETKAWSVEHRRWMKGQTFEWDALKKTFDAYWRAMEDAESHLMLLDQQVREMAEKDPYKIPVQYLRCLKGIDTLSAITLVVETQEFKRFKKAPSYMNMTGMVSSEYSSGPKTQRGSITKVGNAHLRRILVEAAWSYRRTEKTSERLEKRRAGCPEHIVAMAKKAQRRLHRRFWHLMEKGKPSPIAAVSVARELAGFVWAIGQEFPT